MPRPRALACALVLAACSDPVATTTDATGTTGTTTGTTSTDASTGGTTDAPTSTTGDPGSSGGFDPPTPVCGNGYLEAGEECDDANQQDGDGCDATCTIPCGIEAEIVALAPSSESEVAGAAIAPAPDGGFVVAAIQREITSDQEGNQTMGPIRTRVLRYAADNAPVWDLLVAPDDADLIASDLAVDPAGDVYLAATLDADDAEDIHVVKLAGADGAVLWTMSHDGAAAASADLARGLALAPDGDPVVVGRASDVDKDSDVWVRKLAADDGAELWTTTWSGVGNGEYSIDDAGPVAVAPDGAVLVAAFEYFAYNHNEATLLRFPAGGGKPTWTLTPTVDEVMPHQHDAGPLAVDSSGAAIFSAIRTHNAAEQFWTHKIGPDEQVLWTRQLADYQDLGDEWSLGGLAVAPGDDLAVAGTYRQQDKDAQLEWLEAWLERLAPDGSVLCSVRYRAPSPDLLPPSIVVHDAALADDRRALLTGQLVVDGEQQLWIGLFRPD